MFLIATVDRDWAIGKDGKLLYHIPIDTANFRSITAGKGKIVVYGRKTLASLRYQELLSDRENIILTHDQQFQCGDATIVHEIDELKQYQSDNLYIIGGESVFRQLYKECHYAFLTVIERSTDGADAFLPNLAEEGWRELNSTPIMTYRGVPYRFATYRNPILDDQQPRPQNVGTKNHPD